MGERKRKLAAGYLPPWTPFERAAPTSGSDMAAGAMRRHLVERGVPEDEIEAIVVSQMERLLRQETWLNSRYQVSIEREVEHGFPQHAQVVWLSIKRRDRGPVGPERFRDFQRIKNELVGPECEAIEIYPAESRLVDTANQYHLFAFANPDVQVPVGYQEREVTAAPGGGAVQQPFEESRHE